MRSMTGYGRALSEDSHGVHQGLQWYVEIHAVNRKMLDFSIYLPKEMLYLEMDIRQRLSAVIDRGQITVRVTLKQPALVWQSSEHYLANLKSFKSTWESLALSLGFNKEVIDLPFLLSRLDQLSFEEFSLDKDSLNALLMTTLDKALEDFLAMRKREGEQLARDLKARFELVAENVRKIEKLGSHASNKFYHKLKDRIQELMPHSHNGAHSSHHNEDERILREVALYAEKADITEEITRLYSHLNQAFALLKEEEKSIGRTLDFLIQEMQREISTVSAKSANLETTNLALFAKAELEKIREQVQNIE